MNFTMHTVITWLVLTVVVYIRLPLMETKAAANEREESTITRKNTSCLLNYRHNFPFKTGSSLIGEFGKGEKPPELSPA